MAIQHLSAGAARAREIRASGTMAISQKVRDLEVQGVRVINMGGGDPDFPTSPHVVEAAVRALHDGGTHYVNSLGIEPLRQAIAEKLARENGIRVSAVDGIIVTPGAKFAVLLALLGHLNPGDEVLVPEPSWVSYSAMVRLAEGRVVAVPTLPQDGFRIREEALRRRLSPRTRAIIVNHPVNPTGQVLRDDEIRAIAAVATDAGLIVVSDEIYEALTFEPTAHRSLGASDGLMGRTITVNGFSKSYAMTGWRLGYVAGPAALIAPLQKVQQHSIYCVPPFVQAAGVAALEGPQDDLEAMRAEYRRRRDAFAVAARAVRGLTLSPPPATFYVFPRFDLPSPALDRLPQALLDRGGIAATNGTAFGAHGAGHIRFTLRVPVEMTAAVINGISAAIDAAGETVQA